MNGWIFALTFNEKETNMLAACFMLVSCLANSWTLNMEEIWTSVMSVHFHRTTRRYIPAERTLYKQGCENLKSYIMIHVFSLTLLQHALKKGKPQHPSFSSLSDIISCITVRLDSQPNSYMFCIEWIGEELFNLETVICMETKET
jgi:hypothetical protein